MLFSRPFQTYDNQRKQHECLTHQAYFVVFFFTWLGIMAKPGKISTTTVKWFNGSHVIIVVQVGCVTMRSCCYWCIYEHIVRRRTQTKWLKPMSLSRINVARVVGSYAFWHSIVMRTQQIYDCR